MKFVFLHTVKLESNNFFRSSFVIDSGMQTQKSNILGLEELEEQYKITINFSHLLSLHGYK